MRRILFVDAAAGDFHLLSCSAAIDAGDNMAPGVGTPISRATPASTTTVDMGVDEVVGGPSPCPAWTVFLRGDSDGDGIFNALSDALNLLDFGFLSGPPPPCLRGVRRRW